jgi:cell division protein FtsQ
MKRARKNRRKATPRPIKLPRIRLKLPLRWFVVPPAAVGALFVVVVSVRAALSLPIEQLRVEGAFQRITPLQVEEAVVSTLDGGFLTADLEQLKDAIEALDWVDTAELTREWPDTLAVTVTEQQAAARWGSTGLLNVRGDLFSNDRRYSLPELPVLSGPSGSEHDVAARYLELRRRLSRAGLALAGLAMDERGAWTIELAGGQRVRLGRRDVAARLDRFFVAVLPALSAQLERIRYVDLRYTNGFAVAWLDELELSHVDSALIGGNG